MSEIDIANRAAEEWLEFKRENQSLQPQTKSMFQNWEKQTWQKLEEGYIKLNVFSDMWQVTRKA